MAGEGDEDEIAGTESEDTSGTDAGTGDDGSEVSAEHADDQADDGESQEEVAAQDDKPSRGESRIQRLANERAAEKTRADRLEAELIEARRERAQRQDAQTEQQQREMLALMTPEERTEWRLSQVQRQMATERQQDRMQLASVMDRAAYDAKATVNPVYAKYKDVIEAQFERQMAQGRPVEREILLQNHLGKLALEGAGKSGKARRAANGRVESQRVSAGSGKGDTASDRGKAGDTAEKRLKEVFI